VTVKEDLFLSEIAAYPDDDEPRLIFGDWLQERGDPRGELIQVQCGIHNWEQAPEKDRGEARFASIQTEMHYLTELRSRERELIKRHSQDWAGPLTQIADAWQFRRGFLDRARVSVKKFLDHPGALSAAPMLRGLRFVDDSEEPLAADLQTQFIQQLLVAMEGLTPRELDFSGVDLRHCDVQPLLHSPRLTSLQSLSLTGCHIADDGCADLATSPSLPSLVDLSLAENEIRRAGATLLVRAPWIERLTRLTLNNNAGPVRFGRLRRQDDTFASLYDAENLHQLQFLAARRVNLTPASVVRIARSPSFGRLQHLDLSENKLRMAGVEAIANSSTLKHLRILRLTAAGLSDPMIERLAQGKLAKLQQLALRGNRLSEFSRTAWRNRGVEVLF